MKYKMVIICDSTRAQGFQLSAFNGIVVADAKEEAKKQILFLRTQLNVGLIITYDNLIDIEDPEIIEIQKQMFPLLVIIPNSMNIGVSKEDRMIELLKRSIGISVKI